MNSKQITHVNGAENRALASDVVVEHWCYIEDLENEASVLQDAWNAIFRDSKGSNTPNC